MDKTRRHATLKLTGQSGSATLKHQTEEGLHLVFAKGNVDDAAYADADSAPAIGDNSLTMVRALATEVLSCERAVEDAEAALAAAKKRLADVQEQRLPDLMEANNLPEFKFNDENTGKTVKIKLDAKITASPVCEHRPRPNAPACAACKDRLHKWLVSIDEGGAIKHEVIIPAALLPQKSIDSLMNRVRKLRKGIEPCEEKRVEAATLSSIISKRSEAGKDVDQSIVKVNRLRKAKVEAK